MRVFIISGLALFFKANIKTVKPFLSLALTFAPDFINLVICAGVAFGFLTAFNKSVSRFAKTLDAKIIIIEKANANFNLNNFIN